MRLSLSPAFLLCALGACTTPADRPAQADSGGAIASIGYSVGPCFGFCPVYDARIARDGAVRYVGERHVAIVGERTAQRDAATFEDVSARLAPFDPAAGGAESIPCANRVTDQQSYRITWTAGDGSERTIDFDSGCRSPEAARLREVLQALPIALGIEAWTAQTTRPGASRG